MPIIIFHYKIFTKKISFELSKNEPDWFILSNKAPLAVISGYRVISIVKLLYLFTFLF